MRPFTSVPMLPIRRGLPDDLRLSYVNSHPRDTRIVFIEDDHRYLLDGSVQFPISVSGDKGIRLTSVSHGLPIVTRRNTRRTMFCFLSLLLFLFVTPFTNNLSSVGLFVPQSDSEYELLHHTLETNTAYGNDSGGLNGLPISKYFRSFNCYSLGENCL
jgi:hypothetical protein